MFPFENESEAQTLLTPAIRTIAKFDAFR